MNILVLGSTGFIGKNLIKRLEPEGHRISTCSRSTGVDIRNRFETGLVKRILI